MMTVVWRLLDEPGGIVLKISLQGVDSCHLCSDRSLALLLKHLVLNEPFAQFDNKDVGVVDFPELAFGQRLGGNFSLRLHSGYSDLGR